MDQGLCRDLWSFIGRGPETTEVASRRIEAHSFANGVAGEAEQAIGEYYSLCSFGVAVKARGWVRQGHSREGGAGGASGALRETAVKGHTAHSGLGNGEGLVEQEARRAAYRSQDDDRRYSAMRRHHHLSRHFHLPDAQRLRHELATPLGQVSNRI